MRIQRPVAIISAFSAVILLANTIGFASSQDKFSTNYPAVVCPPTPNDLTTSISMASTKTPIRSIGTKSLSFIPSQSLRYNQVKAPVIVQSQEVTPVVWQIRRGVWAGATICSALQSEQWFVGGSADVTGKGRLLMINSGLSSAIVDVEIWNEVGPQISSSITLKANSYQEIGLNSLAPGSKSLVVRTITRFGRVTNYVIDERGRGLRALGGDLVNFAPRASKEINIPAIPHTLQSNRGRFSALSHTLRLLVPGEIDANITLKIFSTDGTFIPAGFENKVIKSGSVISLPFAPQLPQSKFGIQISSDEPILASVYSPTVSEGKSDFIWSTSSPELSEISLSIAGLAPQLVFTGANIQISGELFFGNGKRKDFQIKATDIASLKVPDGVRSITFRKVGSNIYGAGLIATRSGYGYFPLSPGSVLTKSSIPISNIRVLTP